MDINSYLKQIHLPSPDSHKGQNGRLLIIGGSRLFHAASLWALEVASRIVDLVHYSSVKENNKIVQRLKEEFRNGIVVSRSEIESYIEEDDCILIGPGMVREERAISNFKSQVTNISEIEKMKKEGEQTYFLTKFLLTKYPEKKWVIDAGALQMLEPDWIPQKAILTPHHKEFDNLVAKNSKNTSESAKLFAKNHRCIILLKGKTDLVAGDNQYLEIEGGNAGMTKGGTGDVLAGLVAALYCKNDAFTSAAVASYINKKAGDDLYEKKGLWFNASDLADQIPRTMKKLILV